MELEVLIIVFLCATKCTGYAKVNADSLKVKYSGLKEIVSGKVTEIDYDTLSTYMKQKERGFRKYRDVSNREVGSGEGEVYVVGTDNEKGSGDDGSSDDEGSSGGSGDESLPSSVPPTYKVITAQSNVTSPSVVVINSAEKSDSVLVNDEDGTLQPPENNDKDFDKTVITGRSSKDKSQHGVKFTLAIIVGVVVGAILSILIIVFLVYRLRKKDEGSYSLDKQSSASMLQTETDSPAPKEKGGEYIV